MAGLDMLVRTACLALSLLFCFPLAPSLQKRFGDVTESRWCRIVSRVGGPLWCKTPWSRLTDGSKQGHTGRSLPADSMCVFKQEGGLTCYRCNAGYWFRAQCPFVKRMRRQVPMDSQLGGLLGGQFAGQMGGQFSGQMGGQLAGQMGVKESQNLLEYLQLCMIFCNKAGVGGGGRGGEKENGNSVYQLPAISCPRVPSPITAPPAANSTVVEWAMPAAHAPGGSLIFPIRVAGDGDSGHNFPEGRHTITYAAMDSTGFTDTCTFNFEVKVKRCRMPDWPKYGNRSCELPDMIYGTSCIFTCDPGFALTGTSRITCMYDGTYDFPLPKCLPNTCSGLMLPLHGLTFKCTNRNFYGSVCMLICNSARGYRASGHVVTTCLNNGLWSKPHPVCADYLPPKFENCPETKLVIQAEKGTREATVTWPDIIATDNSDHVRVSQVKGPAPGSRFKEGLNQILYTAVDTVGNKAAPCSFSILVEVPECAQPSFGDRFMEADCPNGHEYGASCDLSCRMGVPLEGATSISCEIDNGLAPTAYWDWGTQAPPVCTEKTCTDLNKPKHGAMACDKWAGGTLCQMQCNENYDVPRTVAISQHFVCASSTGEWKPTTNVPDCTELRRPSTMLLPSELYYYTGDCGTSETVELIKAQFIMSLQTSASWQDSCTKDKNCRTENVKVECGSLARRKRREANLFDRAKRSASVAALITWDFIVDFDMSNLSVPEAINIHKDILKAMTARTKIDIQNGVFDLNITGFELGHDSFATGWSDFKCERGQVSVYASASCAACPTGTYFNDVDCKPCPAGTYQDRDGAFECLQCPNGTRSLIPGARELAECKELCKAGTFSSTSAVPCSPCPHGFYQDSVGAIECLPCPLGTTTEFTHTTEISSCAPYDVMVVGPATVTLRKFLVDDLGDFTLTTWFKTNAEGAGTTALALVHPQLGSLLSLDLSSTSALRDTRRGNVSSTVSFPLDTWTRVSMVWSDWTKELTIYLAGHPVLRQTFPEAVSPLVRAGSTIAISTGYGAVIHIQGLLLLSSRRDENMMKAMSSTCSMESEKGVLSLEDIPTAGNSSILVITPSTCDAVDECASNPCPDHTCYNGRGAYHCVCHGGYTGVNCTEPPDFCLNNICNIGSTCINDKDDYTCACPPTFTGKYCQTEMIDVDGGWSPWTDWSPCSATCGGGWTLRMRECNSPAPEYNGADCNGSSVDKVKCNTADCPVCSALDLERGYGARPTCSGDEHSLRCTVSCRRGLTFVEDPPVYHCTGGMWTPSQKIIPCTRIDNPERLELRFKGSYKSTDCVDKATASVLTQSLMSKSDQVSCIVGNVCNMTAKVEPCQSRERRSAEEQTVRLTVTLAINMEGGDVDTASVRSAVEALERSAQELKRSGYSAFSVEGPGVSYSVNPEQVAITPKVTCPQGSISRNAFCVGCPRGTRFVSGRCVLCDIGTYQNHAGQKTCLLCPRRRTTHYRGAVSARQCHISSQDTDSEEWVPTNDKHTQSQTTALPPRQTETTTKQPRQTATTIPQPTLSSTSKLPTRSTVDWRADDLEIENSHEDKIIADKSLFRNQPPELDEDSSDEAQQLLLSTNAATDNVGTLLTLPDNQPIRPDSNIGTIVVAIVVSVCLIALVIFVIFNFIVISRRLRGMEKPRSWVSSTLPNFFRRDAGRTLDVAVDYPTDTSA